MWTALCIFNAIMTACNAYHDNVVVATGCMIGTVMCCLFGNQAAYESGRDAARARN